MKKSLRTVFTAAMFAAANLSALPVSAEEPASDDQWKTIGTDDAEMNWSGWDDFDYLAGQDQYSVYGAQSFFGENRNNDNWNNYSWTVPALEDSDVTTIADDDEQTTTTTDAQLLFTITTTAQQPLYGPVMSIRDFGDLNLDERIDIFDEVALKKMLINGMEFSSYDNFRKIHNADINQDDNVNIADLTLLRKFLLGKIDSFDIDRSKMMMLGKTVETIAADEKEKPFVTTETTTTTAFPYDPREDIVVSLYGIKPAKDIIDQAIWQTKDNIDINISSEDE